jgi:alpha-tubulin suppressor-like RCC1 family protein
MDNSVYCTAFGLAMRGQLGGQVPTPAAGAQSGSQVFATINAVQIPQPAHGRLFYKIAAGENHNLFLSDQLKVLSGGSNIHGQLGNGSFQTVSQLHQQITQLQSTQGQQQTQQQISQL